MGRLTGTSSALRFGGSQWSVSGRLTHALQEPEAKWIDYIFSLETVPFKTPGVEFVRGLNIMKQYNRFLF